MIKRFALALCLLATPAAAGSLSCTATNDAGAALSTASFPITTANLGRVAAMLKVRYGQVPSGPADPVTGIVPMRDRTNAEAYQASFAGYMQGLKDAVKADEGAAAADTAVKAVAAIP